MKYLTYIVFLLFITISCTPKTIDPSDSNEHAVWDSLTNIYSFPYSGLTYTLPDSISLMSADAESLPPEISICLIDTVNTASLIGLNIDNSVKDSTAAANEVYKIIKQEPNIKFNIKSNIVENCVFLGKDAWHFNAAVEITNLPDTVSLVYNGYIFGNKAFVLTYAEKDSINPSIYFKGLKAAS